MTNTPRTSRKKLIIASLALMSVGLGGSIATGAYFTDTKTVSSNQLTAGTVILGGTDYGNVATSTPVTFTNVLPIAESDIATAKASQFITVVRNRGTSAMDWAASISLTSSDFAKQVKVQYKIGSGSWSSIDNDSWSSETTLDALNGTKITSSTPLSSMGSQTISWRAWLPSTTDNSAQGKTVSFDLKLSAIQAGAS